MAFFERTKEFFGLNETDYDYVQDDAYYADEVDGNLAYAPQYAERPQPSYREEVKQYSSTVVPVTVRSYNDATLVGNPFRDGDAVVMDIAQMSRDDAKRIIDFAAGLCFALRGKMEKLESGIFAVIPADNKATRSDLLHAAGL